MANVQAVPDGGGGRGSGGHHRIIRDPSGRVVLQDAAHADELKWINDNIETIPND